MRKPSNRRPRPTSAGANPKGRQKLRIIGGQWRGRKLDFPELPGLRPTTDRVRETLFNWLQPHIIGARCLDAFAGSGALGLEALSRDAKEVVFLDTSAAVITTIQSHLSTLSSKNGLASQANTLDWLQHQPVEPFDVLFLDPPFEQSLLAPACEWIHSRQWLKPNGLIYIEAERSLNPLPVPTNWLLLKEKTAGQLNYFLYQTDAGPQ